MAGDDIPPEPKFLKRNDSKNMLNSMYMRAHRYSDEDNYLYDLFGRALPTLHREII